MLNGLQPTVLFRPTSRRSCRPRPPVRVCSFRTAQPAQFVSGNGGDWIDTPLPIPLPPGVVPARGTAIAGIVATNRFGFMTMERDGARWRMIAHDRDGAPQIACTLQERQANCLPVPQ